MQLFNHQKDSLHFLSSRRHAGLFLEQGMGKTLVMLRHLENIKARKILIICPNTLTGVWAEEVVKWDTPWTPVVLQGSKKKRLAGLQTEGHNIYIINYEGLQTIANELLEFHFDCIVCDESIRIKSPRSKRSQITYRLGKQARYRYIMTGTPISVSPTDIWMQMNFLNYNILGRLQCFVNTYCTTHTMNIKGKKIQKVVGFKNKPQFQSLMQRHTFRKTKEECLDLPDKIYESIPCPMSAEQNKHYESLRRELAVLLDDEDITVRVRNAIAMFSKLHQVAQGFIYDQKQEAHLFKSSKEEALQDLLEGLPDKKVIVWAWFRPDVKRITGVCEQLGRRPLVLDGTSEERINMINDFQNCDDPAVFVGQIAKAGEGITITASSYVVYYGNSWSLAHRLQSEDRNHRIGQHRNVTYYDLVTPGTIDEMLLKSLLKKRSFSEIVTGDAMRLAEKIIGGE